MKTKARKDSIRYRRKIEEKYSWDRLSNTDEERRSHKKRSIIAIIVVISIFVTSNFINNISKIFEFRMTISIKFRIFDHFGE